MKNRYNRLHTFDKIQSPSYIPDQQQLVLCIRSRHVARLGSNKKLIPVQRTFEMINGVVRLVKNIVLQKIGS
jgi:hypothetical protein